MADLRLVSKAERTTHTKVDTISFTPDEAKAWLAPPFQRPLQVGQRVKEVARQIASDGGVLPGILTLGILTGKTYLVDGQHRREAFLLSEQEVGYADVRWCEFETLAEMAAEFVKLNSALARLTTDDILRGMESGTPALRTIRRACSWIGYGSVRRREGSPLLSMTQALKCWIGSATEVPTPQVTRLALDSKLTTVGRTSIQTAAAHLPDHEVKAMVQFYQLCFEAWGRDTVHHKLWTSLNLGLLCWIYRRTVLAQYSHRSVKLTDALFRKCLLALAADATYSDYLVGRQLTDRDRPPTYGRIRAIFTRRIEEETKEKVRFPAPEWAA